MKLNDIWRNLEKEIGCYTKETFDRVPAVPGIYAWFYPLRITTEDPYVFIKEVNTVLNYDASIDGKPQKKQELYFAWKKIKLDINIELKKPNLNRFIEIWNKALKNEEMFNLLRRIFMKASIFMPPLYVGKASRLRTRCKQHLSGVGKGSNFHKRYTNFAKKNDITAQDVSSLLFVAIPTVNEEIHTDESESEKLEDFVEDIMKVLANPIYSVK